MWSNAIEQLATGLDVDQEPAFQPTRLDCAAELSAVPDLRLFIDQHEELMHDINTIWVMTSFGTMEDMTQMDMPTTLLEELYQTALLLSGECLVQRKLYGI